MYPLVFDEAFVLAVIETNDETAAKKNGKSNINYLFKPINLPKTRFQRTKKKIEKNVQTFSIRQLVPEETKKKSPIGEYISIWSIFLLFFAAFY